MQKLSKSRPLYDRSLKIQVVSRQHFFGAAPIRSQARPQSTVTALPDYIAEVFYSVLTISTRTLAVANKDKLSNEILLPEKLFKGQEWLMSL